MEEKSKLFEALDDVSSIFAEISNEWSLSCFEDNFSDFGNFAQVVRFSILQALDYLSRLSELCSRLLLYSLKASKSTEIWNEMVERGFDSKKLCVFAWYLVERGQQTDGALDDQIIGLIGARLYISLCCLNGAQAFSIFNDYLFQRALEQLFLMRRLFTVNKIAKTNNLKGKSGRTKTKDAIVSNAGVDSGYEQLTLEDRSDLREMFFDALDSLFVFLSRVSLSSSQQSSTTLAVLLQQLMQLDFSDKTLLSDCKRLSDFQELQNFSDRSFALTHRFLDTRHGCSRIVYGRIVMPRLLFWTFENSVLPASAHPPKIFTTYKDAMLNFMRIRVPMCSEEELSTILLVLQNICFRCPDRSDYRAKVASCVIETLAILPPKCVRDIATFLWLTGTSSKIALRGFTVEISLPLVQRFGHLLENDDERCLSSHNIVKEEVDDNGEQMKENNFSPDDENPIEMDEVSENENRKNEQHVRSKSKKKGMMRESLVKKIGLHDALLVFLLRSCNDKSPLVRARALTQIAALLDDATLRNKLLNISKTLVCAQYDENNITPESRDNPLLLTITVSRCTDARVSTRKAAIMTLRSLFPYLNNLQQTKVLDLFKQGCRDPSIMVRKEVAESLTRLLVLLGSQNTMLDDVWLASVFPLINDHEQSVVQLTVKLISDTLILPILEDSAPVAWRVLKSVEQGINYRRLLLRSLLHQAKDGELSEHTVKKLLKMSDDPTNMNIIWMLLNFLSNVFKIDPSPVCRIWHTLDEGDENNLIGYIAQVIARCADHMVDKDRKIMIENMERKLTEFSVNECHITHVYYAFARLCKGIGDDSPGAKQFFEFNHNLLNKSLKHLHSIIFNSIDTTVSRACLSQENNKTAQLLVRIICTIGEAIQYSPTLLSKNPKAFDIMQLIMASDVIQQQITQTGFFTNTTQTVPSARPSTTQGTTELGKHEPQRLEDGCNESKKCAHKDPRSTNSSQPRMKGSQEVNVPITGSQEVRASQPTSNGLGPTLWAHHAVNMEMLSPSVRAQAVLAIGKMCLQDEKLAKKCIPVFSRQLLVNNSHLVRCNIVGVICDLCKRYTLLVDRHSIIVASCLKDPSTLVRKQTLMLLTHLIKEQYVRWEGQIMYRFVATLLDGNKEIREYAEMCLIDVLLVQFPNMFVNHFLECVFYFNSVTHGSWLAATSAMEDDMKERHELKCVLSGSRLKSARMTLYKFMIKTFNDENKFTIGMRIGQEVYSAIIDGVLDIRDQHVKDLLEDCYGIMCCPDMKLSMALGKRSPNEADDDDDDEPPSNVQEVARKVVTQAFRKGIIDAILPHIIQLKYYLQEKRLSELEFGIIRVLRELCKDHREQLDEFLASDKQLRAEIKFDLEKLEEKEKRMKMMNNNNCTIRTSGIKDRRKVLRDANNALSSKHGSNLPENDLRTGLEKSINQVCENDSMFVPTMPHSDNAVPELVVRANKEKTVEAVEKPMEVDIKIKNSGEQEENPSTSVKDDVSDVTAKTSVTKTNDQEIQCGRFYVEKELAPRAISTPIRNIAELTFGLGDEMSAIEVTPIRRRTKRVREPAVAPIVETDNETE